MNTKNHYYTSKLLPACCLVLAFFQFSYSQIPGKKETVDYINRKLNEKCVININGATIIAEYFGKDGNKIRQDKVSSGALDTAMLYEPDEQLLAIPCLSIENNCVTRHLYVQKIKRQYSRISFVVSTEAEVTELKKAFRHLIRLLSEHNYKDEISFD